MECLPAAPGGRDIVPLGKKNFVSVKDRCGRKEPGKVIKGGGVAYPEGLEPSTSWSVAKRSIQLSYGYAVVEKF